MDGEVAAAICQAAGVKGREFGPSRALACIDNGHLIGGAIVHDWNPEAQTVEISAGFLRRRAPHRAIARVLADYVFGQMDCQAVILRTDSRNSAVRRFAASMGGKEHILPRVRGRTASEAFLIITDDAWASSKWSGRYENTLSTDAA